MWSFLGPRNISGRVKALAVHPTHENIVYAAAETGGIFKSSDGGHSWAALMHHEQCLVVGSFALAFDPGASGLATLYAGTGVHVSWGQSSFTGVGMYVSSDDGRTWTLHTTMRNRAVTRVVVSPADFRHVAVGGREGLEHSLDGGATWTPIVSSVISDLAWDPNDAATLYACVDGVGLKKITFSGGGASFGVAPVATPITSFSWIKMAVGTAGTHRSNFLLLKEARGALHRSLDGGTSWDTSLGSHGDALSSPTEPGDHTVVAVSPVDESFVVAGGLPLEWTEGGTTWNTAGVPHSDHHALAFAPGNPNILYDGNDGGVVRYDRATGEWKRASNGLGNTQFYYCNFWRPLSTVTAGGCQDDGLNLTAGGLTWKQELLTDGGIFLIRADDPRIHYGISYEDVEVTTNAGSYTTHDSGFNSRTPWLLILAADPVNPLKLFAGTDTVFQTLDGAATAWVRCSQEFTGYVATLAVAPSDTSRVYAGTGGFAPLSDESGYDCRVFRSTNGGALSGGAIVPWVDISGGSFGDRSVWHIDVDRANPDRVLVSLAGGRSPALPRVYLSINAGAAAGSVVWTDVSGDLPNRSVHAAVLDPNAADTMYAATDAGLYGTTDGGRTWSLWNDGLPNVIVRDLALDADHNLLYAATYGRGVYKAHIDPAWVAPAADVYLRDSILDTGERFPSPSDVPSPLDHTEQVYAWESPDLKVDASPFQFSSGYSMDGVEFDEDLHHEDTFRAETNRFYIQIHNRGPGPADNVKVRAFYCSPCGALPNLPRPLTPADDFAMPANPDWTPIGATINAGTVLPGTPVVRSWDYFVPPTVLEHSCLIAVVSSDQDAYPAIADTDINRIVRQYKYICQKNVHVVYRDGRSGPTCLLRFVVFNPFPHDETFDLVVDSSKDGPARLGLLTEPVKIVPVKQGELPRARVEKLSDRSELLGPWYHAPGGRTRKHDLYDLGKLNREILYRFPKGQRSELPGLHLAARQRLQTAIVLHDPRDARTPVERFTIMQRHKGEIIGGGTWEIRSLRPTRKDAIPNFLDDDEKEAGGKKGPD